MEGCLWSVYLALMARKPSPKQQTYCVPLAATLITKVRLHLQKLDMTHALKAVLVGRNLIFSLCMVLVHGSTGFNEIWYHCERFISVLTGHFWN
uniref:Uncharacterized protein n=1 Tax=Oryza punctata TaxID=4537 RepID=A0A0E0JWV5_ORYPU